MTPKTFFFNLQRTPKRIWDTNILHKSRYEKNMSTRAHMHAHAHTCTHTAFIFFSFLRPTPKMQSSGAVHSIGEKFVLPFHVRAENQQTWNPGSANDERLQRKIPLSDQYESHKMSFLSFLRCTSRRTRSTKEKSARNWCHQPSIKEKTSRCSKNQSTSKNQKKNECFSQGIIIPTSL